MSPDVSVVMAALDAEDTIGVQLEALAGQETSEPWELVVADNGSTDRTRELVESFRGRIEHLRIVDAGDRRGAAHAHNIGVREASGTRLLFCDADDEVGPGWIQAMADAVRRNGLVTSSHSVEKLNEPWLIEARGGARNADAPMTLPFAPPLPIGPTSGLGIRRELHEAVGGFDEDVRTIPDTDYCIRVQQQTGVTIEFVPEAVVHYRYRPDLRAIFRQARRYAHDFALLQRRYGTDPPGLARWLAKHWRPVLADLPHAYRKGVRGRLAWLVGYQLGRYAGSLRYRVKAI